MTTRDEARKELARRELARRKGQNADTNTVLERAPVVETAKSKFDELPPLAKLATAGADIARIGSNAVTLGGRDRLAQYLGGGTPEEERAKTEDARERAGSAAIGTEILGMLLPASLASKGVAAAVPALEGSGLLPTVLREGLAGSAIGGGMAAINEEPVVPGLLAGGIGGIGGGVLAKGAGAIASRFGIGGDVRVPPASLDDMKANKNFQYDELERAGVTYDPADVAKLGQDMRRRLVTEQADPELHKAAWVRANRFAKRPPTSIKEFDDQRQLISRDVRGPHGVGEMGRALDDEIKTFIETTQPKTGTAAQANNAVNAARDANRRFKVRGDIEKARTAQADARVENEGPFRALKKKGMQGYTPKEQELLTNIVRGEGFEEAMANKFVDASAKLGSFGSGAAAGGILAGPPGALVGGLSALVVPPAARGLAKRFRDRNIQKLIDEVSGGQDIPGWLKKFLKNKGAAGGGLLEGNIERRRRE